MPRIFDNIDASLLPALKQTLAQSERADFCVGYFNLRGWRHVDEGILGWPGGEGHCCRLLVGMQSQPADDLRRVFRVGPNDPPIDLQTAARLRRAAAEDFRGQLMRGLPTAEDEAGLRRLANELRTHKLIAKLFLRHPLHAKLYLLFSDNPNYPRTGFLGSSNLTFAGLCKQGELNVDVLDHDATAKLAAWFDARWDDRFCLDISNDLAAIIDESWAREEPLAPYLIYLKIAYHLSQEARAGLAEFRLPRDLEQVLMPFQAAAVKIAAHHLNKRGGVLLGDVVGFGKTLMATAVARVMEDDHGLETLILCPKNLVPMWEDHRMRYRLRATVLSLSKAQAVLPDLPRHRLVIIDESHNLRNREGKRYRVIRDYIERNESKVVLVSATPYNKAYLDLSSQLALFVPPEGHLGIRPESYLREIGEVEFFTRHQCQPDTLAGFEKSEFADDWRELMRLYMVRRTRSFIQANYAEYDEHRDRHFLTFPDGTRSYFPVRRPRTAAFPIDDTDPADQYARLFAGPVVDTINQLSLPRYGLGNYLIENPDHPPTASETEAIRDLKRAGKRLLGFCRTNLFKRLESSGHAFLQSVARHALRNFVYLHALDNGLSLPIGTQDAASLDTRYSDDDELFGQDDGEANGASGSGGAPPEWTEDAFRRRASEVYGLYQAQFPQRFQWLRPALFAKRLAADLLSDAFGLLQILRDAGRWRPKDDRKLAALDAILRVRPLEKVLVFSQFADTVDYLERELKARGFGRLAGVTGECESPTHLAWRFSPVSNERRERIAPDDELDVLIATDVLSEGQNLQDCATVVNFDLPWAIIRLIQRAGRVDRIGQKSESITCCSFLPADGVERIINLRGRVRRRLRENAEVVGTDEAFFDDEDNDEVLLDLYHEKSGLLDDSKDDEVDLASYAYQIWKNAIDADPTLEQKVSSLPDVVLATKSMSQPVVPAKAVSDLAAGFALRPQAFQRSLFGMPASTVARAGVLVYMRTAEGNDALAWVAEDGAPISQSQLGILKAAECLPDEPALVRRDDHFELVKAGVEALLAEEKSAGGQLGRRSSARARTYERLKAHLEKLHGTLFDDPELRRAVDDIYRLPLRQAAVEALNRQLRAGIADVDLARLVLALRAEDRLCVENQDDATHEPSILCSMGLVASRGEP